MAEGGRPPKLDPHLLECPICLEQLHLPKSLPCLHSFCQDCLGTYITKELSGKMALATSFPCPVCRTLTHPVLQADSKETWAQQFPTNCLVQELAQLRENTPEMLYCKPCHSKGSISIPAQFWCKTMNTGFCESCKVHIHDLVHAECSMLDIEGNTNPGMLKETSTRMCGKHNEKMEWYCEDHQVLGCSRCIFKDHRHSVERCEEVSTTEDYYERLTKSWRLEDTKKSLMESAEVLESLVKDFGQQMERLKESQEIAIESIIVLRERIDRHLDKLQKDITDELVSSFKEEKRKIEASMQQCERLMTGIEHTLKSSSTALDRDDSTEVILMFQRGKAEVASCKDLVTEMRKSFTTVSVTHNIDPSLATLDNSTLLTLGKIAVQKQRRCFPESAYLETPLSQRRVKEIGKIDTRCPLDDSDCGLWGAVYLQDGNIVVADEKNRRLKLFTDKGQYLDELTVRGSPHDMCRVENNTVGVAVNKKDGSYICVVKIESNKLSLSSEINVLHISEGCYGITYTDGRFVLSTAGGEVYSVAKDGTADSLHNFGTTSFYLSCEPNQGQVLVSHHTDVAGSVVVSRLSADKHKTDVLKVGVVRHATGIDVDREGNIYVCGYTSNNVVQMSEDGTHVRELLTEVDGVNRPRTIAVCGDKFVLTNISDDQRKYVRVFQLY